MPERRCLKPEQSGNGFFNMSNFVKKRSKLSGDEINSCADEEYKGSQKENN
jgi:hypothetical protein